MEGCFRGREGRPACKVLGYVSYHIKKNNRRRLEGGKRSPYRIFYHDCPPLNGRSVWQPWDGRNTTFGKKSETYQWITSFQASLERRTKVAMRMGTIAKEMIHYVPTYEAMKGIQSGAKTY